LPGYPQRNASPFLIPYNPNVAATVWGAVMLTVQVLPLTVAHPVQFLNFWPLAGVAVRVTVPLKGK
jgi:hypothetical protein